MFFRHGDVYFFKVDEPIPANTKPASKILALGETTGHRHEAVGTAVDVMEVDGRRWVVAPDGAEIKHLDQSDALTGEHSTITLPPGVWEVVIQREHIPGVGNQWVND